jgi:transaldolase
MKKMKFFADTASIQEIDYDFSKSVSDGITTNPKIMETTGDLSGGFEKACKDLIARYPNVPISLETDLRGINVDDLDSKVNEVKEVLLSQAYDIASWGKNTVIKIPVCQGGLEAAKILSKQDIKTNITACMTPYQALEASKTGSAYVSLFANRMLDCNIIEIAGHSLDEILANPEWKKILKENTEKFFEQAWKKTCEEIAYVADKLDNSRTELIVGSIRSHKDIYRLIKAKPQIITIPTKIVQALEKDGCNIVELKETPRTIKVDQGSIIKGNSIYHPMTSYTIDEFEKAADIYRKK